MARRERVAEKRISGPSESALAHGNEHNETGRCAALAALARQISCMSHENYVVGGTGCTSYHRGMSAKDERLILRWWWYLLPGYLATFRSDDTVVPQLELLDTACGVLASLASLRLALFSTAVPFACSHGGPPNSRGQKRRPCVAGLRRGHRCVGTTTEAGR